jgi:hypothetical protein
MDTIEVRPIQRLVYFGGWSKAEPNLGRLQRLETKARASFAETGKRLCDFKIECSFSLEHERFMLQASMLEYEPISTP